ncbi:MAG TPA: glycosyltransferase [Longimicrobiales bacterium]
MRLLFVGTSPGLGGTETHFVTLAQALAESGDAVAAVVKHGSAMEHWLSGGTVRLEHGTFRNAADPRGLLAVGRAIRRHRPEWLVGSFSKEYWPLLLLGRAAGLPVALFKHMDFPMRPLSKRWVPRLADPFIVISDAMRRSFIGRGIPAGVLHVLPNPIDTRRFRATPVLRTRTRHELGFADGDIVVGYLGRFSPEKGLYVLADALEQAMPRASALRALWLGAGPDEEALRARLGASRFAARHVTRPFTSDPVAAYAALDALVVPSTIAESFGRVAAEAEACGVPVVASRIGGIPEAVEEERTALLVRPGDAGALAQALLRLAGDAGLRRRLGAAGPRLVQERFAAPVVAQRFRELLRSRRTATSAPPRPIEVGEVEEEVAATP